MKNLSTQISFQPSMNEPHNGGRESRMCGGPVKVTTGTLRRQTVSPRQPPPQSTHHPSMTRLHPPPHTHTHPQGTKCVDRSRFFLPVLSSPLLSSFLENLFALLPRQGEGASPPFWLLFSAPALSQHSVSSSQSPCQQDFTQWPGELQSVAQPQPQQHTHTHTNTHSLQTHLRLHSADRLVNRHL